MKIHEKLLQKNALVLEPYFGGILGALGPLLGTSWASLGHLSGLLGRLLAASDEPKTDQKSAGVKNGRGGSEESRKLSENQACLDAS